MADYDERDEFRELNAAVRPFFVVAVIPDGAIPGLKGEEKFLIGIEKPFNSKVAVIEERVRTYCEREFDAVPFGGNFRLRYRSAIMMPDENIGVVMESKTNVYVEQSKRRGALKNQQPVEAHNAVEDCKAVGIAIDKPEQADIEHAATFVVVGDSKSSAHELLKFGPTVTQDLESYSWVLEFESLPTLPQYRDGTGMTKVDKFPFKYLGFVKPDRKVSPPSVAGEPTVGQWLWDGWYGLRTESGKITYGFDSIWQYGGKLTMKIQLLKRIPEKPVLKMKLKNKENCVCLPDITWDSFVDEVAKKDLELVIYGLSEHWKVKFASFSEK